MEISNSSESTPTKEQESIFHIASSKISTILENPTDDFCDETDTKNMNNTDESLTNNKIKDILIAFNKRWFKKSGYPKDYCNIASGYLQKILWQNNIHTEKKFTYEQEGEGHTFLVSNNGLIIDPTYGQFDDNYLTEGLVSNKFPNDVLNENIKDGEEFMKLQLKRFEEGLYTK